MRRALSDLIALSAVLVVISCDTVPRARADVYENTGRRVLPLPTDRAYSGAPPTIEHDVPTLRRSECLKCHLNGDAVGPEGKKAAKTPHPELTRCVQCHVEQTTEDLFVENSFSGSTYTIGLRGQPNGPPLIPHPLTLRENCLGCHGPGGTQAQLITDHPERLRCVQCHIPVDGEAPGKRPGIGPSTAVGFELPEWSL